MIQLSNEDQIRLQLELQKQRINNSFRVDENIQKAITIEQFQSNYPAEKFDFYTEKAIDSFKSDISKSEDSDPLAAKAALDSLEKLIVKSEDGSQLTVFYASKKESNDGILD